MEKTISINLGGALFYMEEDAYNRLDAYLREVKRYFDASGDDSAEILRDIEASLAEQFNNAGAGEQRRAVTLPEVEAALKNMGTVKDFSEEEKDSSGSTAASGSETPRRFYRDSDDAIIAGVCSGLAHYFGFDPVWVRLAFVLSLFFWGFGVWLYLIIWLAAPEAKTTAQKLAMQGEAVNLSSLTKLKDNLSSDKLKRAGSGAVVAVENFLKKFFSLLGRIVRNLGGLIRFLFAFFLSLFALIGFCGFMFLGAAALFSGRQYLEPGLVSAIGWPYPWLVLSAVLTIALPCLAAFFLGLMIFRRKNFLATAIWLSLLGIWFFSFLGAGAIGSSVYARVRPYVEENRIDNIPLQGDIKSLSINGRYYLKVVPGNQLALRAEGHPVDLANIAASLENGELKISTRSSRNQVCFHCGRSVNLVLTAPASLQSLQIGESTVLNLENWLGEKMAISFSGASGGNLLAQVKELDLKMADEADVDLLGGQIKSLIVEAGDNSRFDSGNAVIAAAKISLSGAARASVRVQEKLQAIFAPDAPEARLFYNPDLKQLEVDPAFRSQLRFLGQEDDPEITVNSVSADAYTVVSAPTDTAGTFTVSQTGGKTTITGGTVTGNSVKTGSASFQVVGSETGAVKIKPTGTTVSSFEVVPASNQTGTATLLPGTKTIKISNPATRIIKVSAPVQH